MSIDIERIIREHYYNYSIPEKQIVRVELGLIEECLLYITDRGFKSRSYENKSDPERHIFKFTPPNHSVGIPPDSIRNCKNMLNSDGFKNRITCYKERINGEEIREVIFGISYNKIKLISVRVDVPSE